MRRSTFKNPAKRIIFTLLSSLIVIQSAEAKYPICIFSFGDPLCWIYGNGNNNEQKEFKEESKEENIKATKKFRPIFISNTQLDEFISLQKQEYYEWSYVEDVDTYSLQTEFGVSILFSLNSKKNDFLKKDIMMIGVDSKGNTYLINYSKNRYSDYIFKFILLSEEQTSILHKQLKDKFTKLIETSNSREFNNIIDSIKE
ncbi:hypothetical protein [Actinobacillus pleuropneumoniae]|uniref:hypothetical protein n=1 Tax=Actinobacillus pleuropneumoniae TaxID=715 RepID=UPI003B028F24